MLLCDQIVQGKAPLFRKQRKRTSPPRKRLTDCNVTLPARKSLCSTARWPSLPMPSMCTRLSAL